MGVGIVLSMTVKGKRWLFPQLVLGPLTEELLGDFLEFLSVRQSGICSLTRIKAVKPSCIKSLHYIVSHDYQVELTSKYRNNCRLLKFDIFSRHSKSQSMRKKIYTTFKGISLRMTE